MTSAYTAEPWFKLSRRILDSSVWEEDPATRILWVTLVGLAQLPEHRKHGHGVVIITPGNLTRRAYITAEQFDHALSRLTAPDPRSRTNPGGPRLEVLPNGYRILAFSEYHDSEEFDRWHTQRVEAGKARAAKGARSETASGRGGRGRFTSGEPAVAGTEPATPLVDTRKTLTLTDTLTNGLQKQKAPATRAHPDSTRWADVYLRHFPKATVPGPMFKALAPLCRKHGWSAVEPELDAYLARTPIDFQSWPKFAAGFGKWTEAPPSRGQAATANNTAVLDRWEQDKLGGTR